MSDKRGILDVWLTEGNTIYKEVPFTVVVDWIQQGRLLEEDQVRPTGTEKWFKIGATSKLAAYLPKIEPNRVNDQAEALEEVAVDFRWKKPHDEDDDIDMIPLIDISLVLLIFFMMTANVIMSSNKIDVPAAQSSWLFSDAPGTVWLGIDRSENNGPALYSFGIGQKTAEKEAQNLNEAQVVAKLTEYIDENKMQVDVRIAADRRLPAETVMNLTAALEPLRARKAIKNIRAEVNEKK
jgi:biopolymer transport protein ExbD